MGRHEPLTNAERSARHRAKMRARGYRLKQFWLPDLSDPRWKAEFARQAKIVADCPDTQEAQDFIESVTDEWLGELDEREG